jgi:hypothetical protein
MKKLLFTALLLPLLLNAQSFMISDIPLPKTYVEDLDPYECDEACMQDFLQKDMIFSFLAHADKKLENKELDDIRSMNIAIFNLGAFNAGGKLKIALILPYKKIGKYASSTTNATFAYLMTKSNPFTLKSYRIESEESGDIQKALQAIEADGFEYVIAPLTKKGADNIIELHPHINIYFPTINKEDINISSSFYTFGGIDYKAQSRLLLKEAVSPLIIFSDKSATGKKLASYQKQEFLHPTKTVEEQVEENGIFGSFFHKIVQTAEGENEVQQESSDENLTQKEVINFYISRRTTNLEKQLKENEDIINGSFMLNTPIIKSGMIMSQLTLYDTNATNILSTQINYDPLLLSMTQYIDREHMIIANSIIENNTLLIDTNALLGNDIVYDWINYTTTVGIDYFYNQITGESREYNIHIKDHQMIYDIELVQPGRTKFIKYIPPKPESELEEG